jgi:hypothetical protein
MAQRGKSRIHRTPTRLAVPDHTGHIDFQQVNNLAFSKLIIWRWQWASLKGAGFSPYINPTPPFPKLIHSTRRVSHPSSAWVGSP